ncbi:hypothetical protein SLUN_00150 [Streptomyces lunaelactis]|uniref:Replication-relaxation n=1 Tax=Streptomyces lunaelactis TaxID=1535768 RepID=A0A2R4SVM4_9ACTN|nr:replication-relaxation family protein [Streptomyces lunaelactis]AVZ70915.1 hypothetical protein SLUN_00150 [Streptomyces lunaelactis]NUK25171.1 replication-relaxation family protein [Streptomyces lunaelactis]NUK85618.1 replication-relaxation family protein [Streptomyces lunaelactis]
MTEHAAMLERRQRVPVREQALAILFQHRAADTGQLRRLIEPPPHPETMRQCLRALRTAQLVVSHDRAHHSSIWSLTEQGRTAVTLWPQFKGARRYRGSEAGLRSVHTLTVTRAALAFVEDGRARRDECSALDWTTEVAHPVRDGAAAGERTLIADALLRYTRTENRCLLRAFVEVDRTTESSEQLASKLITYARFHASPAASPSRRRTAASGGVGVLPPWQLSYPVFPRLLFVLTGAGPLWLGQRIADLRAMVRQHPLVGQMAEAVPLGAAVLEDLEERGASAPVWTPLGHRQGPCSWMDL